MNGNSGPQPYYAARPPGFAPAPGFSGAGGPPQPNGAPAAVPGFPQGSRGPAPPPGPYGAPQGPQRPMAQLHQMKLGAQQPAPGSAVRPAPASPLIASQQPGAGGYAAPPPMQRLAAFPGAPPMQQPMQQAPQALPHPMMPPPAARPPPPAAAAAGPPPPQTWPAGMPTQPPGPAIRTSAAAVMPAQAPMLPGARPAGPPPPLPAAATQQPRPPIAGGIGGPSFPRGPPPLQQQQQPAGMLPQRPPGVMGPGMPPQPMYPMRQQQQQQQKPMGMGGMRPPPPMMAGGFPPQPMQPPMQQQQQQQAPLSPLGAARPPFSPAAAYSQQQQQFGGPQLPLGGFAPPPGAAAMLPPHLSQQPPGAWAPPSFGAPPPPGAPPGSPRPPFSGAPAGQQLPPSQQAQQPMGGRNIDPGSMPRPSPCPPPAQIFTTRVEGVHAIPPPTECPIAVRDTGCAGPRHMRCSLNSVPQGADLLKSSSLPFVVLINPLAVPEHGDTAIEVIDPGPAGPLRCSQCKAYVCPFMQWPAGGRMQCCFCGGLSDVPPGAFSGGGSEGPPELRCGSVEYEVTGEYQVRPPVAPTYYFLIEVTAAAVGSGATAAACASLAQLLDELPGGDRARVAVATFDSRLHFYSPRESGGQPTMLVVTDVAEPFCPLGGGVALRLGDHKPALKALLESIPKTFAGTTAGESVGGSALKAAVDALKAGTGGRLIAFLASLPQTGTLALRPREAGRPPSDRDTLDVMQLENKSYAALAADAADHQVSVDVFALSQGYVDLATLSVLTAGTSGSLHRYNPFTPPADGARFHNDLRWCLVRPQGMEAVSRLRCSRGLAVENYVGAFHRRNLTDLHFPALSCDHAVAARLVHEERLQENSQVCLQYALLYTTTDGHRRVRVHTVALPVTRSLGSVFRGADLDTYVTYVARKVSAQLPGRAINACRDVVIKAAVDTLVAYRKHVATASSSGQLILPEALKLLPLYALGLTKLPCFRTDARADSRAVWLSRLLSCPPDRVIPAVHPRLLALRPLADLPAPAAGQAVRVPDRLWLSAEKLDPEGIFLLENGFDAHIFVGPAAPQDACQALLGVPTPEAVDASLWAGPPALDTPLCRVTNALLNEVRRQRRCYMHLRLMRRGHPHEAAFMASLVEDRSPSAGMSYVEFLCMLHRQIQNKLS